MQPLLSRLQAFEVSSLPSEVRQTGYQQAQGGNNVLRLLTLLYDIVRENSTKENRLPCRTLWHTKFVAAYSNFCNTSK